MDKTFDTYNLIRLPELPEDTRGPGEKGSTKNTV